jgi:hemoglobin
MKKEIENREDIKLLVNQFYESVLADPQLAPFFADAVQTHWPQHLELMYRFWDNILFYTGGYTGNPMVIHQRLHDKTPLSADDFARWEKHFIDTLDTFFIGEKAQLARQRAIAITTVMQLKILGKVERVY